MKQIILSIFLLFIGLNLAAQDFVMAPSPVVSVGDYDMSDDFYIIKTNSTLTNTTTTDAELRWTVVRINVPVEWRAQLCDENSCYAFDQKTNIDENVEVPLILEAGTESIMDLGVRHNGTPGVGIYEIRVTTVADTTTLLASNTVEITANALQTSIEEFSKNSVKIFPNPTNDFFTLTENTFVSEIQIFNIVGKRMAIAPFQNGDALNVSSYPNGLYLVRMLNDEGEVLKTTRLTKR